MHCHCDSSRSTPTDTAQILGMCTGPCCNGPQRCTVDQHTSHCIHRRPAKNKGTICTLGQSYNGFSAEQSQAVHPESKVRSLKILLYLKFVATSLRVIWYFFDSPSQWPLVLGFCAHLQIFILDEQQRRVQHVYRRVCDTKNTTPSLVSPLMVQRS